MTTQQLANLMGVQHELVRDAAGELLGRTKGIFTYDEAMKIRGKICQWKTLRNPQQT
jgi:hypothetical protein